jgi:hypothetical protein
LPPFSLLLYSVMQLWHATISNLAENLHHRRALSDVYNLLIPPFSLFFFFYYEISRGVKENVSFL